MTDAVRHLDAGIRRHDILSLRLKASDFNHARKSWTRCSVIFAKEEIQGLFPQTKLDVLRHALIPALSHFRRRGGNTLPIYFDDGEFAARLDSASTRGYSAMS